jgi:very-short-patch-repair endonuclease
MEVTAALAQLGGSADARSLRELVSRRKLRKAVVRGTSYATVPGRMRCPTLDAAMSAVRAAHGARSHLSAALHWGWELKQAPALPMITVPRGRNLSERRRIGMQVFWAQLTEAELEAGVTAPLRTVIDCAQRLPWDVALTVADSALRSGAVTREDLLNAADAAPARHRRRACGVAAAADARSAGPFESVLRAIALQVPGLDVVPQVAVGRRDLIGQVDLADVDLGIVIVIEAGSWAFHGNRTAFDKDVRRYTAMTREGWLALRFLWDEVMRDPDYVWSVLQDAVRLRTCRAGWSLSAALGYVDPPS